MRGGTKSDLIPPHSRQGFALPPSPKRGFYSSSSPSERDRWVCAENQPLCCRTFGAMWASPPTRMVGFYHSAGPGLCLRDSLPSPAWRGCRPLIGGCGGDPYRVKPGFVEWERFFPSSVTPYGVPPSPQGKASYRRGCFLTFPLAFQTFFRLPPLRIPYCVVK